MQTSMSQAAFGETAGQLNEFRRLRKANDLALDVQPWLVGIRHESMHDRTVSIAFNLSIQSLMRLTPGHLKLPKVASTVWNGPRTELVKRSASRSW